MTALLAQGHPEWRQAEELLRPVGRSRRPDRPEQAVVLRQLLPPGNREGPARLRRSSGPRPGVRHRRRRAGVPADLQCELHGEGVVSAFAPDESRRAVFGPIQARCAGGGDVVPSVREHAQLRVRSQNLQGRGAAHALGQRPDHQPRRLHAVLVEPDAPGRRRRAGQSEPLRHHDDAVHRAVARAVRLLQGQPGAPGQHPVLSTVGQQTRPEDRLSEGLVVHADTTGTTTPPATTSSGSTTARRCRSSPTTIPSTPKRESAMQSFAAYAQDTLDGHAAPHGQPRAAVRAVSQLRERGHAKSRGRSGPPERLRRWTSRRGGAWRRGWAPRSRSPATGRRC